MEQKNTQMKISLSDDKVAKALAKIRTTIFEPMQERLQKMIKDGLKNDPDKSKIVDKQEKLVNTYDWLMNQVKDDRMDIIVLREENKRLLEMNDGCAKEIMALVKGNRITCEDKDSKTSLIEIYKKLKV